MLVSQAIEQLQKLPDDQEIIFAYWEQDQFCSLTDEEWEMGVGSIEDRFDWSMTHDQMKCHIDYCITYQALKIV